MKKLFLAIAAVATLLASCSKDDAVLDSPAASGEQVVTFEVSSPELDTRYGEGEEATTLEWYVYEGNTPTYVSGLYGTKTFNKSTTVQIKFIIGRTYHVLFWAHADGAPYKVDPSDATMVVDYAKLTANQESYDAFYKFHEVGTVTTSTQGGTVELKRPFAQLNIGTSDTNDAIKANLNVTKTGIKVKTFSTMNFKTGNVGGEVETTFNIDDMAEGTVTINDQEYDIISMNYLLVNEKQTPDVVLSLQEESGTETLTRTFTSIPVERNHRTYILGTIYTQPANFNVVIDAKFDDDHFEEWDGTTYDEIKEGADGFYSVSHAAEFAWILKNVKEDVKIRLEADINFGGHQLEYDTDRYARVTIEGNGNRILNFVKLNSTVSRAADAAARTGLFSDVATATVSNLTIEGADVDAGKGEEAYAGALFGRTYGAIKLTNVTVNNSKVAGTNKVGGLIGLVAENEIVIENCHVINTDITTHDVAGESGLAGGLIGYLANYNATKQVISNSSVKGGVFNVINSKGDASRANSKFIGAVGGSAKVELINCSVDETGMTYNETANGYTSPYGDLVGGNRGTATVIIDGTLPAATEESLSELIENAEDGAIIGLCSNEDGYTIPHTTDKSLTFIGLQEGVIVKEPESGHNNDYYKGATLYFENLIIEGGSYNGKANGYVQSAKEEYKNCTFKNYIMFAGDKVVVTDCTFEGVAGTYFWTGSAENVMFTNCKFNGVDRAVKVCSVGNNMTEPRIVTFNDCEFRASASGEVKAAIEIDAQASPYKVYINNSSILGTFTKWYNEKNDKNQPKAEVYIDGAKQ